MTMNDNRFSKPTFSTKSLRSGCGFLFFAYFLAFGALFLAGAFWFLAIPAWRARTTYKACVGVVVNKKVEVHHGETITHRPLFRLKYTVAGREYTSSWTYDSTRISHADFHKANAVLARYEVGKQYPCWYDPKDPNKAVLVRDLDPGLILFLIIPLVIMGIGAGGILYVVRSRRGGKPTGSDGDSSTASAHVSTRPRRLTIETSERTLFWSLAVFALIWNAVTWLFVGVTIAGAFNGQGPRWLIWLFLTPFMLIGIVSGTFAVFKGMITFGIGATAIDVSTDVIKPGESCEVLLTQEGPLVLNSLTVSLVGEEWVVVRAVRDNPERIEKKGFFEGELYRVESISIPNGFPLEARFSFHLPEDAAPSSESDGASVVWMLSVKGNVARRPKFERRFPIVVLSSDPDAESPA